mmetsp:Transcript_410/g.811  ORF Transcript_410/g.811 Transcript_410/m.811 type:complete len:243 (+) Transcript_410:318-1046(+)|eukprot:CAMPEP_0171328702 /NCGR_PEP_ID=MMETSP0878-20121228/803_1 /TAXON_ID=67004 /ORGANISM="Thalassiosira weissflogii, Strain CCMP1336" /LENGTH=242 /DNA_ID=CAMNT_0011828569 /DNA_START=309 /DNA_END=1037 /DNA_ORIENTATION=+
MAETRASSSGALDANAPSSATATTSSTSLSSTYPVNTLMELKLAPNGHTLTGLIYCTDDISNSIVVKKSLVHTTLSSEITVINATSVLEKRVIRVDDVTNGGGAGGGRDGNNNDGESSEIIANQKLMEMGVRNPEELTMPLPNVSRKALEERERRALRLAEESFSHINQKASPTGQKTFDKLLKACNEVVWKGESILVLNHIKVDPPYTVESCSLVGSSGSLDDHSLERVKKIVAAAAATSS